MKKNQKTKLIISRNPSKTRKAKFRLNLMPEEFNTNIAEIVTTSEPEKVDEATLRTQNKDLQECLLVMEQSCLKQQYVINVIFLFFFKFVELHLFVLSFVVIF